MRGLMMDVPLLVPGVLDHGARYHAMREIVSRSADGALHRTTYAETQARTRRLASALARFGFADGDRIGTLAWNSSRHFELYYAIPGAGLVCHTINPRLFAEQLVFIINDAQDRLLFVDPTLVPLAEKLAPALKGIEAYVVMCDRAAMPATSLPNAQCYEDLVAGGSEAFDWHNADERDACGLCYTSGTTDEPKGVLYSHRSTVLHAIMALQPDMMGFSRRDVLLPCVPMFHVNAWGMPYMAPIVGAKFVMPGPKLDGPSLLDLVHREGVTFAAGVPTIWLGLLAAAEASGSLAPLERTLIGGSAVPESMIRRFEALGVRVIHGWGMTETSPLGAVNHIPRSTALDEAGIAELTKQGRGAYGIDLRITDTDGTALPWDGIAFGNLEVRGPWVADGYFHRDDRAQFTPNGWFQTGDVATIAPDGLVEIVDRTKDVIKSGGEWISSITLENLAVAHPGIREAAAIARRCARWGERPRLIVTMHPDAVLDTVGLRARLETGLPAWSIPDDVIVVADLPHTATGKLQKRDLRARFGGETIEGSHNLRR